VSEQKRHAELVSASMNEIPKQVRDDSDYYIRKRR